MRKVFLAMFMAFCSWCWIGEKVQAQDIAVKTNALYWLTTTPNLGVEFAVGDQTTFSLEGGYNPWTLNKEENRKLKHWMVLPEFRYWLCEAFNGHFFGINSGYTFFNISGMPIPFHSRETRDYRYQGWATGVGLTYGYSWIIGKRLNLELTLGVGYVYSQYDKYECRTCGDHLGPENNHYFGPTKAGISLIYMLK